MIVLVRDKIIFSKLQWTHSKFKLSVIKRTDGAFSNKIRKETIIN